MCEKTAERVVSSDLTLPSPDLPITRLERLSWAGPLTARSGIVVYIVAIHERGTAEWYIKHTRMNLSFESNRQASRQAKKSSVAFSDSAARDPGFVVVSAAVRIVKKDSTC